MPSSRCEDSSCLVALLEFQVVTCLKLLCKGLALHVPWGPATGFHSGHVWEPQLYQATVANGENADRLYLLHKHQLSWVAYETTHSYEPISTLGTSLLRATDDLIEVCGISNYNPQLDPIRDFGSPHSTPYSLISK